VRNCVARADDGHTFFVADSPHTIIPAVQPRVPYDAVNDFVPVGLIGAVTMILMVNGRHPARDLQGFLGMARAQPDVITFGSSGPGSLTHLLPEWLAQLGGVKFTIVPYRGGGPALLDVAAGQLAAIFSSTLAAAGPLERRVGPADRRRRDRTARVGCPRCRPAASRASTWSRPIGTACWDRAARRGPSSRDWARRWISHSAMPP
jgi:hypothetical protein